MSQRTIRTQMCDTHLVNVREEMCERSQLRKKLLPGLLEKAIPGFILGNLRILLSHLRMSSNSVTWDVRTKVTTLFLVKSNPLYVLTLYNSSDKVWIRINETLISQGGADSCKPRCQDQSVRYWPRLIEGSGTGGTLWIIFEEGIRRDVCTKCWVSWLNRTVNGKMGQRSNPSWLEAGEASWDYSGKDYDQIKEGIL